MASFKVMFHYFLGPRTRELLSLPRYEFWSSWTRRSNASHYGVLNQQCLRNYLHDTVRKYATWVTSTLYIFYICDTEWRTLRIIVVINILKFCTTVKAVTLYFERKNTQKYKRKSYEMWGSHKVLFKIHKRTLHHTRKIDSSKVRLFVSFKAPRYEDV